MSSCTGEHLRVRPFRAFGCQCFILKKVGLISLSRGPPMGFSWVMLVILEHFVCLTLILT
jgi:hypothetical protein